MRPHPKRVSLQVPRRLQLRFAYVLQLPPSAGAHGALRDTVPRMRRWALLLPAARRGILLPAAQACEFARLLGGWRAIEPEPLAQYMGVGILALPFLLLTPACDPESHAAGQRTAVLPSGAGWVLHNHVGAAAPWWQRQHDAPGAAALHVISIPPGNDFRGILAISCMPLPARHTHTPFLEAPPTHASAGGRRGHTRRRQTGT